MLLLLLVLLRVLVLCWCCLPASYHRPCISAWLGLCAAVHCHFSDIAKAPCPWLLLQRLSMGPGLEELGV